MTSGRTRLSSQAHSQEITTLVLLGVVSIILWHSPFGPVVMYPFSILATWFHEMGHGLAALAFGHDFERLVIFPNGSGYALYVSEGPLSRVALAVIAAAGLLGPTVAGCLLILASRRRDWTTAALLVLGTVLIVSTLVWVRSVVGWAILPAFGIAALSLAWKGAPRHRRFAVQFLGVQGCISIYRDFGYVFSPGGFIDGRPQASDTQQIADALFLPYWFWGVLITAAIGAMIFYALRAAHGR